MKHHCTQPLVAVIASTIYFLFIVYYIVFLFIITSKSYLSQFNNNDGSYCPKRIRTNA